MNDVPVIVADDDSDAIRQLEWWLARAGLTVESCHDSAAAFDLVESSNPAVLLLGMEDSWLNALALCKRIRASAFSKRVHITLLSKQATEEDILTGLEAGADDFLRKPANSAELLARIRSGNRCLLSVLEREEQANRLDEANLKLRREMAMRERTQGQLSRIRMALDDAGDAIAVVDQAGRITYINIAFSELFHCTAETLNDEGWSGLFRESQIYNDILKTIKAGDGWRGQTQMQSRKERVFPAEVRAAPIVNEVVQVDGLLLLINDITERKRLEQKLLHSQKLESIGQLAAGIAHEINTPTQYIGDNTRFVQKGFDDLVKALEQYQKLLDAVKKGTCPEDLVGEIEKTIEDARVEYMCEEIPEAIAEAMEGIERVAEIVRAMKEFSHPGVEGKTSVDINKAIQSTITVASNEWKYVADMETHFDEEMPLVPCLAGELNQVILNILVNAAHAIGDVVGDGSNGKGVITVTTRRDGEWAEIRIQDTGCGIAEDMQERIFDPFYTTKEVGQGTGQGLSIAYSVVAEKHGGTVAVDSKPGEGATFIVRLPLIEKKEEATTEGEFVDVI